MLPRRSQAGADGPDALPDELRCGSTEIDFRSYEARSNGEPVEMTRKEFAVLRFLASRAGQVVTRDDLLNEVWGYESYPSSRTVDNHVAGLRAKLEPDASQRNISGRYMEWGISLCRERMWECKRRQAKAPAPLSSRTVDNHVAGLRAKLERDASQPEHIRTVHGVGYKFVP